jgi:hypothetical protein
VPTWSSAQETKIVPKKNILMTFQNTEDEESLVLGGRGRRIWSSRPAWATQLEPVSRKRKDFK